MTELLLANEKKDINSTLNLDWSLHTSSFSYDNVYETLRYANPKSCYKKPLLKILTKLYRYQYLIIIQSFIIGIIFFGMPLLFIYFKLLNNRAMSLLIICSFGLFISILFIVVPCIDSKRKKYNLAGKTERENIFNNIGNIFLFILLTTSVVFSIFFYNDIALDKDKKIKFDYDSRYDTKVLSSDFIFKYIIYILLLDNGKIDDIKNKQIKMIYDDWDINNIRKTLFNICIPLLIIIFFSLLKVFLIKVRQTIWKVILLGGLFILLVFQCFINSYGIENLQRKKLKYASLFQNIVIIIILLGYIFWNINYSVLFLKKRKDKNFAIRKCKNYFICITICIDIITCLGYCIITIAILFCYYSFNFKEEEEGKKGETYSYLNISFLILKIGFFPIVFGNSYYFGYYFLSMIYRPLALAYAPYELKNKYYIKARRKLMNFMLMKLRKEERKEKIKKVIN